MEKLETKPNKFGVIYKVGEKLMLSKKMSTGFGGSIEVEITSISNGGSFFYVSGSKLAFSIHTLNSRGSTIASGYYLYKANK